MMCYGSFSRNKHYDWYWQYRALFIALQSIAMFILIASKAPKKRTVFGKDFVIIIARASFMIYLIHPFFLDLIKTELHYEKWSTYVAIPVFTLMTFISAWIAAAIIAFVKSKLQIKRKTTN